MGLKETRFFEQEFQRISGTGDLRSALAHLVQIAAEGAKSNSASFYIVDPELSVLRPLITYGLPASYIDACGPVRIGDQCCGRAVEHCTPWIISDMLTDPLFSTARSAAEISPIRAAFSVPAIAEDGECLGSLACHYSKTYAPTAEQIRNNEIWANMVAHTISQYKDAPADTREAAGPEVITRETGTPPL
jgi:GAF domain-containing protein